MPSWLMQPVIVPIFLLTLLVGYAFFCVSA